ncbi:MAG: DNRLRE domain-containing protein [Williamsia sp.]|nr:DNRLRE domain-containing protein [Williamsia sp.]
MLKNPVLFSFVCLCAFLWSCKKQVENQVPKAIAGIAQSITLPTDTVTLTGSATDADGTVVAYLWSQVSGPSQTTIINPGSPSTLIKNSIAGRYVFQLTVTDNKGATGKDTTSVLINPAVIKNLTAEPARNPNEILLVNSNGQDQSSNGTMDIPVEAWTRNNGAFTTRGLIKFDLSTIPGNSTIVSANLYLYSYPSPTLNGNFTDANFGTNNTMLVQQVTANWSASSITWFNQPAVSTSNQITIATTPQSVYDLNVDVTEMVGSMIKNNSNYGFMLRLQNEQYYNSRIFISSFNTTYNTKHPKLVIQYK